ncbi:hypothetical protein PAXINDRAFT_68156 [Paxillus involutus ATCC 200175]|nr:hypothetical protein PAXINDRAFT_68156 [Paxillus involutus ATCC 200175]
MPQPYSPASGAQIESGAITYTTTTGPDGRTVYHPFSYQTPQGVVHGIQWVPAEATQILPAGATPATAEFAASWDRSHSTRHDEKAFDRWQKSDEKRRKKEEKESIRRLSKQFDKDMQEVEHLSMRDRDVQATRERSRSFYGDNPPGYGPPGSAPYSAYAHSPSNHSDLDRKFTDLEIERETKYSSRQRKYSTNGGDRTSGYGPPPVAMYQTPTGYPTTGTNPYNRAASPYRQPSVYSTSPNTRPQEVSKYPGGPDSISRAASPYGRPDPIARAASPYGRPDPIARAASPYGRPPVEPIARAASPYGRPPVEPIARAASPYGRPPIEPIARAASPYAPSHSPYGARAPSPIPPRAPSPYARGPQNSTSPYPPRAPSPYAPQMNSGVYPPGHVLEGQPLSRSRAPSPMPGPPGVIFPSSPRMPGSVVGGDLQQLAAPEAFSRPANAAQPYTPFSVMKIQDMEQFYDQIPRMPLVLDTHDVYHQDWIRFMNDLALAWAGKMPIPEFSRGPPPKRSTLAADLIDLWNTNFFLTRRVEVVLYKGRERRSGPSAGSIDYHLPGFDVDSSSEDSSLSSSESDSDDDRYPGYGRGVDLTESRRRHKEKKEEKKRRKKEKKLRKKAKEREKTYSLFLTYVPPRSMPGPTQHGYYT